MHVEPIISKGEALIGIKDAAQYLGLKPTTVRRMARKNRIPHLAFPIGANGHRLYRFRASEIEAFLNLIRRQPGDMANPASNEALIDRAIQDADERKRLQAAVADKWK
jgi:excisionase family DNA binding protein